MRMSLAILLSSAAIIAASATAAPPRARTLSFRNLSLKPGEHIAAIQIDITGASFEKVTVPYDWGLNVSPPVAEACTLKAGGQHSSAFLSPNQLQKFVTIKLYEPGDVRPFSITASIVAIWYDSSDKEHQRVIKLPKQCIVLD